MLIFSLSKLEINVKHLYTLVTNGACSIAWLKQMTKFILTAFTTQSLYYHQ